MLADTQNEGHNNTEHRLVRKKSVKAPAEGGVKRETVLETP